MMVDEAQYYDFAVTEMNNTGSQVCNATTFEGTDPQPTNEKACHCVKAGYVDASFVLQMKEYWRAVRMQYEMEQAGSASDAMAYYSYYYSNEASMEVETEAAEAKAAAAETAQKEAEAAAKAQAEADALAAAEAKKAKAKEAKAKEKASKAKSGVDAISANITASREKIALYESKFVAILPITQHIFKTGTKVTDDNDGEKGETYSGSIKVIPG